MFEFTFSSLRYESDKIIFQVKRCFRLSIQGKLPVSLASLSEQGNRITKIHRDSFDSVLFPFENVGLTYAYNGHLLLNATYKWPEMTFCYV